MNPAPILAGVVGSPIGHSLSPLIHTVWASRAKIDGFYVPIEAPPGFDAFAQTMKSFQTLGFAGVNVTLPHKENALRYASAASDVARNAGAANMLTFSSKGVFADNSDVGGFAAALRGRLQAGEKPRAALMLGAGGAARGVILALRETGCKRIIIANRTREKAAVLAGAFPDVDVLDWEARNDAMSDVDILVNTTSLGMTRQPPLDMNLERLKANAIVADIVYAPLETPLLKAAKQKALRIVDGLDMLMHQAAPGFQSWFGAHAAVDASLRATLVEELHRRSAS